MQKTFNQMLVENGADNLDPAQISPNSVIPTNIVLEPNSHQGVSRVRVTARDKNFKLLWGVNVSEGLMPSESTTPVAFYGRLRELIREHLTDPAPRHELSKDPFVAVQFCISRIREILNKCEKETVLVKKKTDITEKRAEDVADIMFDLLRKMNYDLSQIGILSQSSKPADAGESK